jgi:hypothetical protein
VAGTGQDAPAARQTNAGDGAPTDDKVGDGSADPTERQTPDTDGQVDEQTAAEEAERQRGEAERREHAEALRVAGHARFAAMRVALERKLNRATVQRYVNWAYLRSMTLPGYDDTPACELLGIEHDEQGDEGTWPILAYAAKGDRELERAVLAVAFTASEEWLRGEWPRFDHPMVAEHYALLAKLGYEPQEVEQRELAKMQAEAGTDPESDTVTGELAETPVPDADPVPAQG